VSEKEIELHYKTSTFLGKDTRSMTLNEIIEGLVNIIETKIKNDKE
jgi:hypothetical protein